MHLLRTISDTEFPIYFTRMLEFGAYAPRCRARVCVLTAYYFTGVLSSETDVRVL